MEKETQQFLKAEETAGKLVQTLEKLRTESASYHTASEELDKVRGRLINLIQSTEEVVKGSREIVGVLKEIGGPEILDRLTKLKEQHAQECATYSNGLKILNRLVMLAIAGSMAGVVLGIASLIR